MKKEMFDTEITLLRDTFRRLLRRHANSNIIKLIGKTHPADMALIYRYFNDEEQDTNFCHDASIRRIGGVFKRIR